MSPVSPRRPGRPGRSPDRRPDRGGRRPADHRRRGTLAAGRGRAGRTGFSLTIQRGGITQGDRRSRPPSIPCQSARTGRFLTAGRPGVAEGRSDSAIGARAESAATRPASARRRASLGAGRRFVRRSPLRRPQPGSARTGCRSRRPPSRSQPPRQRSTRSRIPPPSTRAGPAAANPHTHLRITKPESTASRTDERGSDRDVENGHLAPRTSKDGRKLMTNGGSWWWTTWSSIATTCKILEARGLRGRDGVRRPHRPGAAAHPAVPPRDHRPADARHERLRAARGRPRRDSCPFGVIVLTGHGDTQVALDAMKAGADDFVTKPYEPDHLRFLVQRILERRRLIDELEQLRKQMRERLQLPQHGVEEPEDAEGLRPDRAGRPARLDGPDPRRDRAPARSWSPRRSTPPTAAARARSSP